MFEFLMLVTLLFLAFVAYTQVYPLARKYMSYRKEREALSKQYNRTWRARKDMLVISFIVDLLDPL